MATSIYLDVVNQRDNLVKALLLDSQNPNPDYSVGGQQVSRTAWRESLLKQINGLNNLMSVLNPVEFRTQVY